MQAGLGTQRTPGFVEVAGEPAPFHIGGRHELVLDVALAAGALAIVYEFEGEDCVAYSVYTACECAAGANLRWSDVQHYEMSDHERETLKGILQKEKEEHDGEQH